MSLNFGLPDISSLLLLSYVLWVRIPQNDVFFSVQHIRKHIVLICPITGDVNFNHFVKMVPVEFLFFFF